MFILSSLDENVLECAWMKTSDELQIKSV